jgi:hypothetical protein
MYVTHLPERAKHLADPLASRLGFWRFGKPHKDVFRVLAPRTLSITERATRLRTIKRSCPFFALSPETMNTEVLSSGTETSSAHLGPQTSSSLVPVLTLKSAMRAR